MKNLVSRNPVQRFKQGRKIVFAKPGDKMLYNGKEVVTEEILDGQTVYRRKNGSYVYSNDKLLSPIKQNSQVSPSIKPSDVTVNIPKFSPENTEFVPQYQKDITHNWLEGLRNKYVRPLQNKIVPQQSQTQAPTTVTSSNNKKGNSFKSAFDQARNSGLQEFTWNGKRFNTMKAGETKEQWLAGLKPQTITSPTITFEKPTSVLYTPKPIDNIKIENIPAQTGTYDRTGVREFIRNKGINPYSFSGAQRRALRMVLNNTADDNDKLLVKGMGLFKQGGSLLPSRNLVKRFKLQRKGL